MFEVKKALLVVAGLLIGGAALAEDEISAGQALFEENCVACHTGDAENRAPSLESLQQLRPTTLFTALTFGKMQEQGAALGDENKAVLIDWLAGAASAQATDMPMCEDRGNLALDGSPVLGAWGFDVNNTRHTPAGHAGITRDTVAGLKLKWAFGVPGADQLRSQPLVTPTTMFVATSTGDLFALDRETGCLRWHHSSLVGFRSSPHLGRLPSTGAPLIIVTDLTTVVTALDARTGDLVWRKKVGLFASSALTGGPVQSGNKVYVPISAFEIMQAGDPAYECCKSHGGVIALDAETGDIIWTAHMTEDAEPTYVSTAGTQMFGPSGAPIWTTPMIDEERGQLYVGTGENTSSPATGTSDSIIALDLQDGSVRWVFQALANDAFNISCSFMGNGPSCPKEEGVDFDFGASVILTTTSDGTPVLIAGQKSGDVYSLNPDTGELNWNERLSDGTPLGGIHWGLSVGEGRIYAAMADPPFPLPNYKPRPGLYALDVDDGSLLWEAPVSRDCTPPLPPGKPKWPDCSFFYALSAAVSSAPGLVVTGAKDGRIRINDAATGEVLWIHKTNRAYDSVNGVETHGGAIDSAGPIIYDGQLIVQSGYAFFNQMPGNALLVFEVATDTE